MGQTGSRTRRDGCSAKNLMTLEPKGRPGGSILSGSARCAPWSAESFPRHDGIGANRTLPPRADRSRAVRGRKSPAVADSGGAARRPALCRAQLPGGRYRRCGPASIRGLPWRRDPPRLAGCHRIGCVKGHFRGVFVNGVETGGGLPHIGLVRGQGFAK
jgi:hypothetical protein